MMDVRIYSPLELHKVPIITICMSIPSMFELKFYFGKHINCNALYVELQRGKVLLNYYFTENK